MKKILSLSKNSYNINRKKLLQKLQTQLQIEWKLLKIKMETNKALLA